MHISGLNQQLAEMAVLVTCLQTHVNTLRATAELNLKEKCFAVSFPACLHYHP